MISFEALQVNAIIGAPEINLFRFAENLEEIRTPEMMWSRLVAYGLSAVGCWVLDLALAECRDIA